MHGLGLTHTFFRGWLCKKCWCFPILFWPPQWFLLLACARKKSLPLSSLPSTHIHTCFGASLCPSLLESTDNEQRTERQNPVFSRQALFSFYLSLFWGVKSFGDFFPLLFLSKSGPSRSLPLPLAGVENSPAFLVTSCALYCLPWLLRKHGPWSNFPRLPLSSRFLASSRSRGSPTVLWAAGAGD